MARGVMLGWSGVVVVLALAVLVACVRAIGSTVGQRHAEGPIPTIAFGALLAAPGLLAVIGLLTRRPVMVGAGGVACVPLAILSILTVPILIPAGLLLVAFVRADQAEDATLGPVRAAASIGGCVTLLAVAVGLLVLGMRPYTYEYATGGEQGAYVPASHGVAALAVVGVNLALTTLVAAPGLGQRHLSRDGPGADASG